MYENLNLTQPNFEFLDGFFYSIDTTVSPMVMTARSQSGSIAKTFFLSDPSESTQTVKCLAHDGAYWWTLQNQNLGFTIKRWQTIGDTLVVQDSFGFTSNDVDNFSVPCVSIEHYHFTVATYCPPQSSSVQLNTTTNLLQGQRLTFCAGPYLEEGGSIESRFITKIQGNTVTLNNPLNNGYYIGALVSSYSSLWVFNDNAPYGSRGGCLYKIDPYKGYILSRATSGEFSGVAATCFDDTLIFVKGCTLLTRDCQEGIYTSSMTMDNFQLDNETILRVYDLTKDGQTLYRLQDSATFWTQEGGLQMYTWSTKNFQLCILNPYALSTCLTIEPRWLSPGQQAVVKVAVRDQYNVGLAGLTVSLSSPSEIGTITPSTAVTDAYGNVSGLYTAQTGVGEAVINATVTQ